MARKIRPLLPAGTRVRLPKRMGEGIILGLVEHTTSAGSRIYRIERTLPGGTRWRSTISECNVTPLEG